MQKMILPAVVGLALIASMACGGSAATETGGDKTSDQGNDKTGGSGATSAGGTSGSSAGGTNGSGSSTNDSPAGTPSNGSGQAQDGGPELELWREVIYTGTDGQHSYDIPVATVLVNFPIDPNADPTPVKFTTPPTFEVADATIATQKSIATPSNPAVQKNPFLSAASYAVISPKKPGETSLTVTYGNQKVTAAIHVTAYTPAQYTLGMQRYTAPANAGAKRVPCTQCHNAASTDAGTGAPPHDPFVQQDLSDSDLVGIVTKGLYDVSDPKSALDVPGGHSWDLTAEEQAALPAYLRSLHSLGF